MTGYTSLEHHHYESPEAATRRRHLLAGSALIVCLASFVGQTEAASQLSKLGYQNAIFMLYLTHSSWTLLAPLQVLILWLVKRQPLPKFYLKHTTHLRHTAQQIVSVNEYTGSVQSYFLKVSAVLAIALNIAGASWYLAVNWTTPADLTAIYNCSAFFAYAFSVPLLHESLNVYKIASVFLSIAGVFAIAYSGTPQEARQMPHRGLGNLVISIGAVLYGLYEVLYKRVACPPQSVSSKKQAAFASVVASMIGVTSLTCLWPVLVVLHFAGVETFRLPRGQELVLALVSVFSNMIFSGSFLVLISLTSPVLGSVAGMLTTFIVPLVDFAIFGQKLHFWGIVGGLIVVAAFLVMSWASWKEMQEEGGDESDDE